MKITREKPSLRRHHRVSAPLTITVDGIPYQADDWSLGGFALSAWTRDDLVEGSEFLCSLTLPFQGFQISFEAKAGVVRVRHDVQILAARFVELGERQHELLSHFTEELMRGAMSPVGDTILRIDSPVTPVSTEPDPNPPEALPFRRRTPTALIMSALYLTAGFALLVYFTFTLYANFFSLEVDSAVVAAPVEKIVSGTDGLIRRVAVREGELVAAGTPLIELADTGLEEQIELGKVSIDRARVQLETKNKELEAERERLEDYRFVNMNKIREIRANLVALRERRAVAARNLERFTALGSTQVLAEAAVDQARAELANLEGQIQVAEAELERNEVLLAKVQQGRFFNGERFEGRTRELEAEVERLREEILLAGQELVALYRHRQQLTLYAPAEGRLVQTLKTAGNGTRRGEAIALFERNEKRVVHVFLTQEEVLDLSLGGAARVFFAANDRAVDAVIAEIDRTGGYLNETAGRYDWHGEGSRTARVTLAFRDIDGDNIRRWFAPGLPAVVVFPRLATGFLGDFVRSVKARVHEPVTGATG